MPEENIQQPIPQQIPQPIMQPQPVATSHSKVGYIFGGLSFIPLFGVLFGIIAIIIGIFTKSKLSIFLGVGGILFSVILYGSLFYFGFVAKSGPFADIKVQLTQQIINQDKAQILAYKTNNGKLPDSLSNLPREYMINPSDAWLKPINYKVNGDGTFELRSDGPDGIPNNSDDILPNN